MIWSKTYRNFIKQNEKYLKNVDEVILVKCKTLSNRSEKVIKTLLGSMGIIVKDLWYQEQGVGEMGISIAIKQYFKKSTCSFTAIAIRGKNSVPILYYTDNKGMLIKR